MSDEASAYFWLKEHFPNLHPLGGAVGTIGYLGYVVRKYIPFKFDQSFLDDLKPQESECIQKEYKHNEEVLVIKFDTMGIYVKAFAGEETCIPFNFFKSFRVVSAEYLHHIILQ